MIVLKNGVDLVSSLAVKNSFDQIYSYPLIVVLRNTRFSVEGEMSYVVNNGKNNCDSLILLGSDGVAYSLVGRTLPHEKYQKRMVEGTARANYVATGMYRAALRKGLHRGKEALVQNKSYIIFRSRDMILGNEDDYIDPDGFVGDNFHGNAPYSAGCITVEGKMLLDEDGQEIRSGDWKFAHEWIYHINKEQTFFSSMILDFDDASNSDKNKWKLRPGSVGDRVAELQRLLGIKVDGDFGPMTFHKLRKKQRQLDEDYESGIYDYKTRVALEGEK